MEKPLYGQIERLDLKSLPNLSVTMTQSRDIEELRERIKELEQNDEIFARRSNTLLDEILITDERLDRTAAQVQENTQAINRLDEQLERLADRFDELANGQLRMQEAISQLTILATGFARQAEADRVEIRRIWQYLLEQKPNGREGSE